MNVRSERGTRRRRFLALCGGGVAAALGGCTGTTDEPRYREGQVNRTGGEPRTAQQMAVAEALAVTDANADVSPLGSLVIESHEFVAEDGYRGPTVRGVVSNTGSEPVDLAEVRVRTYDDDGAHLGRYMARTGDIAPETAWRFGVILLDPITDIAEYDVAVLGLPG